MHIMQRTLDGGAEIAGLTPIQRQLAQIMWDEPETQGDEDLLAARWLELYQGMTGFDSNWDNIGYFLRNAIRYYRKADIRRRRQELAEMGLFPWPQEEAERRQKRARGGPPG